MFKKILLTVFFSVICISVASAAAKSNFKSGDFGIAAEDILGVVSNPVEYPWIQAQYFVTDNVAFKPTLLLNQVKIESDNNLARTSTTTEGLMEEDTNNNPADDLPLPKYGIGAYLDYYISLSSSVNFYIGPGLAYLVYERIEESTAAGVKSTTTTEGTAYVFGARVGAQYMFSKNFGLFVDIGISYTKGDFDVEGKTTGIITRDESVKIKGLQTTTSGLGVVFYL